MSQTTMQAYNVGEFSDIAAKVAALFPIRTGQTPKPIQLPLPITRGGTIFEPIVLTICSANFVAWHRPDTDQWVLGTDSPPYTETGLRLHFLRDILN